MPFRPTMASTSTFVRTATAPERSSRSIMRSARSVMSCTVNLAFSPRVRAPFSAPVPST